MEINSNPIIQTPSDVLHIIFSYLPLLDIFQIFLVCKNLHRLLRSHETLWKNRCLNYWKDNNLVPTLEWIQTETHQKWIWFAKCIAKFGRFYLVKEQGKIVMGTMEKLILNGMGVVAQISSLRFGQFVDGELNGKGKHIGSSGEIFTGDFLKGIYWGFGFCSFLNGDSYLGGWKRGKFHGKGTFTWRNGIKYQGDFEEWKQNGRGVIIYNDGVKLESYWNNGQPISNVLHPEIKNCIDQGICTSSKNLPQWIYNCCERFTLCYVCWTKCHMGRNHGWMRKWTWNESCRCKNCHINVSNPL